MEKMTMTAFLTNVISANVSDEVTTFAQNELAKIKEKNEKKRNTMTATQKENAEIKKVILSIMNDNVTYTSPELTKLVNTHYEKDEETAYTTNKISALMRQLATDKKVNVIDGYKTSKGKVKGYVKILDVPTIEIELDESDESEE